MNTQRSQHSDQTSGEINRIVIKFLKYKKGD